MLGEQAMVVPTGCETLLDDFDPLRETVSVQLKESVVLDPSPQSERPDIAVTNCTPDTSYNPFRMSTDISDTNPFALTSSDTFPVWNSTPFLTSSSKDMRHCISDTNLFKLEYTADNSTSRIASRSQEDVTDSLSKERHCVAEDNPTLAKEILENDPLDYKNRRVNRSQETSPSSGRKTIRNGEPQTKPRPDFLNSSPGKPLASGASMELPETLHGKQKRCG